MTSEPMLMLDNMKLWKDILDKKEGEICNEMTESEHKAYQLGVKNLFDLFWQILESNHKEGCYTVLCPDENIKLEEFTLDDFCAWHRQIKNKQRK
jgi:hypothetical protein